MEQDPEQPGSEDAQQPETDYFHYIYTFTLFGGLILFNTIAFFGQFSGAPIVKSSARLGEGIRYDKLAFLIVSSAKTNKDRVQPLMETWGNRLINHPAISDFYFLSVDLPELKHYPSISVPKSYENYYSKFKFKDPKAVDSQIAIKDAYAMRFCVENTTADWCLRLMDDLYVNEEGFNEFVEWLQLQGNPWETPMVFGNCMDCGEVTYYLQGGSGYIFSRKAAELLVENEEEWLTTINTVEDWHLTHFLNKIGLNSRVVDCPYFTGHFIRWAWWNRFNWNNHDVDYPPCPKTLSPENTCNHTLFPYHKVAFVHALKGFMNHNNWKNWFSRIPREAMIYYTGTVFHVCQPLDGQLALPTPSPTPPPNTHNQVTMLLVNSADEMEKYG